MNIIESLINARKLKRWPQVQLAQKLGVPQSYVAKIESGKTDVGISKIIEIARLLDHELMLVPKNKIAAVRALLAVDNTRELGAIPAYQARDDD